MTPVLPPRRIASKRRSKRAASSSGGATSLVGVDRTGFCGCRTFPAHGQYLSICSSFLVGLSFCPFARKLQMLCLSAFGSLRRHRLTATAIAGKPSVERTKPVV